MTLSSARTDKIFYFESVEKTSEAKVNVLVRLFFILK